MPAQLSPEQAEAMRLIAAWYKNRLAAYLTIGGYAGTGKTTLIAYLRRALTGYDDTLKVAFCSYTGKASRFMAATLRAHEAVVPGDSVGTIHSLMYVPEDTAAGLNWRRKDGIEADLIIVDEASMVDETIWRDLLTYGIPVLAVGDHGQLPPVGSDFNLMANPQIRLERIWRQAQDSPILKVAAQARENGAVPLGKFGSGVVKYDRSDSATGIEIEDILSAWNEDWLVLCGFNVSRQRLNQAIRSHLGFESPAPAVGDRVVALRNNRRKGLYNGLTGRITELAPAGPDWLQLAVQLDGEERQYYGYAYASQFGASETLRPPMGPNRKPGDLFDFGYALTVHKAQGSQAPAVLLFEERSRHMDDETWRRWLYTGVTRAQERLVIVGQ